MKKSRSSGERIRGLRDSIGDTQAQFAGRLGVKQGAVSTWEKDDKLRRPSAVIYLKLAALARDPQEAKWFLERADVEERIVFSLAEKLGTRKVGSDSDGNVVRIGPLAGTDDIGELKLSRSRVPNPNFTYYAAHIAATWLVLEPGYLVLDTKDRGDRIAPFWNEIVVVRTSEMVLGTPRHLLGHVHPPSVSRGHSTAPPGSSVALLAGWGMPDEFQGFQLGRYTHEDWGKKEFHRRLREEPEFAFMVEAESHARAYREMRTVPGVEIIGKVIAWFPYEKRGARGDE